MKASGYIGVGFVIWLFTLFIGGPYFLEGRALMALVITVIWGFIAGACIFEKDTSSTVDNLFNKENN